MRVDERIAFVSKSWTALTQRASSDALEESFLDSLHPDHVWAARAAWMRAIESGTPFRYEAPMSFAGGERGYRWVAIELVPRGADADVWFGTLADVDDRWLRDEALRESAARYRAFSEALPGMTWSASPDGALQFVGDRWSETRGMQPERVLGEGWLDALHPDDRESSRARWRASIESGEAYEHSFRVRMADGSYRWQLARAHPRRTTTGEIAQWIGVNIDIEEQRRADNARELFVALAESSSDFIATADSHGNVGYVNEAGRRLLELDDRSEPLQRKLVEFFTPDERETIAMHALPVVAASGRWLGDANFVNARTGADVPVECNLFALTGRLGQPLGIATISHDRRDRERIESGLRLLARTSAAALDSLDYAATLRNIARAFVVEFASYCIIDSLDAQRHFERTAAHRNPSLKGVLEGLSAPPADHPIARAIATGASHVGVVDESWALGFGDSSDRIAAVRALGVRSFITVPIFTPLGDIVGALTCALDGHITRENYNDNDRAFVEEVGRRAGAAFANARLYERERRIAVELQSASLPTTLPRFADLELDAEYRPGSAEATIGGDWYDAFELEDGRVALTVGDVLGHGLHAAVTMTKLRQAMQAAAMIGPDPGTMLTVADKTLRLIDPDGYATAIAAIYDRRAGTLTYASAGHPGPLLRATDGTIVDFTRSGAMLGLRDPRDRDVAVVAIPDGSSLVFFTDGLIEATRDIDEGLRQLRDFLQSEPAAGTRHRAKRIVEYVLAGNDASDDIAVLVANVVGRRAPEGL